MAAKRTIPRSACVHLFGAGHPSMFALADRDGLRSLRLGRVCPLCKRGAVPDYSRELQDRRTHRPSLCLCGLPVAIRPKNSGPQKIANAFSRSTTSHVTLAEIARIRQAIADGTLWELVDERCRGHPQLLAGYRALLEHAPALEAYRPGLETPLLLPGQRELPPYRGAPVPATARPSAPREERARRLRWRATAKGSMTSSSSNPRSGRTRTNSKRHSRSGRARSPNGTRLWSGRDAWGSGHLAESHPGSRIFVSGHRQWKASLRQELGDRGGWSMIRFNIRKRDGLARTGILGDGTTTIKLPFPACRIRRYSSRLSEPRPVPTSRFPPRQHWPLPIFPRTRTSRSPSTRRRKSGSRAGTVVMAANWHTAFANPRNYVDWLVALKEKTPPDTVWYAPAAALPSNVHILCHTGFELFDYIGVDLKSAQRLVLHARRRVCSRSHDGRYLRLRGLPEWRPESAQPAGAGARGCARPGISSGSKNSASWWKPGAG